MYNLSCLRHNKADISHDVIFKDHERRNSPCCWYGTVQILLITNLHNKFAWTAGIHIFQFSDLAKNWQFCTPIITNISIPPPLDRKNFDIQRIFWKCSNVCGYKNSIVGIGVCELWKNSILILIILTQSCISEIMTLFMTS